MNEFNACSLVAWFAVIGWVLAGMLCWLWLDAVKLWDKADNEAKYLSWRERMNHRGTVNDE